MGRHPAYRRREPQKPRRCVSEKGTAGNQSIISEAAENLEFLVEQFAASGQPRTFVEYCPLRGAIDKLIPCCVVMFLQFNYFNLGQGWYKPSKMNGHSGPAEIP